MSHSDQFVSLACRRLKESGHRITQTRRLILSCLSEAEVSLSPKKIFSVIGDKSKGLDQTTVYRNLEVLESLDLIHHVQNGFIACTHLSCQQILHLLVHCQKCGVTKEIDVPKSTSRWFVELKEQIQFSFPSYLLQTEGFCQNCT